MSVLPLEGVRIVDLTAVLMGPYCTAILADLGAEVIRIDPPQGGFGVDLEHESPMTGIAVNLHRNKHAVLLDLKTKAGLAALKRLIRQADGFVSSMRPQALQRLGLDHATLAADQPGLISVSAHGFAAGGPYAQRPAYDDIIQAMSGAAALQSDYAGHPQYMATDPMDKTCGLFAALGFLAAFLTRQRTGLGQEVELPMFEAMTAFLLVENLYGAAFEPPKGTTVYPRIVARHRRPYATKDGLIALMVYTDAHWQRFFSLTGQRSLLEEPRFATLTERTRHIDELYGLMAEIMVEKTTAQWLALLEQADIPAAPVLHPQDLLDDPQLTAVGFWSLLSDGTGHKRRYTAFPVRFSAHPIPVRCQAPQRGADTLAVLAEAGFSAAEIAELTEQPAQSGEGAAHPGKKLHAVGDERLGGDDGLGCQQDTLAGTMQGLNEGRGSLGIEARHGLEVGAG